MTTIGISFPASAEASVPLGAISSVFKNLFGSFPPSITFFTTAVPPSASTLSPSLSLALTSLIPCGVNPLSKRVVSASIGAVDLPEFHQYEKEERRALGYAQG